MSAGRRSWLEVSVRSPTAGDRSPLLVEALLALGGRATEERDGWHSTHLEAPSDLEAFLADAEATLREVSGLLDIEVRTGWCADEQWTDTWKRGIQARQITDRILVRPSWLPTPERAGEIEIVIDPGLAFGTAEHGTTRGCLRLLERAVAEADRVLDVGAGSGILAIASALLGASEVVAFEADALACEALRGNVERNRVEARVRCVEGLVDATGVAEHGPVAGVVANIVTNVLSDLMPGLSHALEPGGWLILSGVQHEEWSDLRTRAERYGLRLVDLEVDGEWWSGWFVRDAT